jgi:flagellar biosynthesis regulator FlbT
MGEEGKGKSFDEKLRALNTLIATQNKGLRLESRLMLQNMDPTKVQKANNRLAKKIEQLRGKIHDEWVESADDIQREVSIANGQIERAIKAIEKRVKIAENIVKAVGYIDRVVETASKVLATIS